ncbi:MAG: ABC transporter permease [Oscillospiraceae bacterium]|nr:ABC transporter permease [Oscillospiraceae bacterium]
MTAVLKHELRMYNHALPPYLFCAFLLAFVGVGAMLYNIQSSVANFELVLKFVCIGLVVIVPILTMRVFAEEKKQKTDQLLYALPLKLSQIVLGKYLALLAVFLVPMAIISCYPLVFSRFGDVYLPTAYGSLFAFFLLGAAMIAIGMFISSLTENQGFAAGISITLFLLNFYSVRLAEHVSATAFGSFLAFCALAVALAWLIGLLTGSRILACSAALAVLLGLGLTFLLKNSALEGLLPKILSQVSLFERFYVFADGVFDLRALVFYLTVIVFFLFLSVQSLEKRRYN